MWPMIPPKRFDIPPPLNEECSEGLLVDAFRFFFKRSRLLNILTFPPLTGGCSEGLGAFRFFFKQYSHRVLLYLQYMKDKTTDYVLTSVVFVSVLT